MIIIPVADFSSKLDTQVLEAFAQTGLPTQFKAQKASNGVELMLYDVIGTAETNARTFAQALTDAGDAPLTIRLSSPGGSVFDGLAMHNLLAKYPGDTKLIVDGVCCSIATVLALGAKHV